MTAFLRRSLFAFVLGVALATAVLFGRSALATSSTIEACFKPSNGTLYLLGGGSGRTACQSGDIPISWNTAGVNGQDGVSVTSEALAAGEDPACPNGGSKFTSATGNTYACNGTDGQNGVDGQDGADGQDGIDGQDGADGVDGEDFDGSFTSPSGQYRLNVDDLGARIEGPAGRILLDSSGIRLLGALGSLRLQTSTNSLESSINLMLQAGGLLAVDGVQIELNGDGCGVMRNMDFFAAVGLDGGPIMSNPAGSPTIRTGC